MRKDICSSRYQPSQLLPSESELCVRFAFRRIVIEQVALVLICMPALTHTGLRVEVDEERVIHANWHEPIDTTPSGGTPTAALQSGSGSQRFGTR